MKKLCAFILAALLVTSAMLSAPAFAEEFTGTDKQWAEMVYSTFEDEIEALESGNYGTALRTLMGDGFLLRRGEAPKQIKVKITDKNVFDYFSINDEAMAEFDENGELVWVDFFKTLVLNYPGYEINVQETTLVCNVFGDYNFYRASRDDERRIDVSGVSFEGLILDPSIEFKYYDYPFPVPEQYPTPIYTQVEGLDTISWSGYSFLDNYGHFEQVPVINPRTILLIVYLNQSSFISDPSINEFTRIGYGFKGTLVLDRIG